MSAQEVSILAWDLFAMVCLAAALTWLFGAWGLLGFAVATLLLNAAHEWEGR